MPVTSEEWETDLESVDQVAARDTEPSPPPTEPANAPLTPPSCLLCCGVPGCKLCACPCGTVAK